MRCQLPEIKELGISAEETYQEIGERTASKLQRFYEKAGKYFVLFTYLIDFFLFSLFFIYMCMNASL
jgi:uncharacterized protein YqhQ